jgi:hypothetical protein
VAARGGLVAAAVLMVTAALLMFIAPASRSSEGVDDCE